MISDVLKVSQIYGQYAYEIIELLKIVKTLHCNVSTLKIRKQIQEN